MARKKRLHELARELDVTTDRLMELAMQHGMRFSSNFNAVEPEQEERLRTAVLGPIRKHTKPIVKIVKTAKQKALEAEAEKAAEEAEAAREMGLEPELVEELPETPVLVEEGVTPTVEETAEVQEATEEQTEEIKEEEVPAISTVAEKAEEKPAAILEPAKEKAERIRIVKREEKPTTVRKEPEKKPAAASLKEPMSTRPQPVERRTVTERPNYTRPYASDQRRKKKRKRKEKAAEKMPAAAAIETPTPGKKRAKMPTLPSVDHIMLTEGMTIKDLADKLGIKAKDIIAKLLMEKGVMANINQVLDIESAKTIAEGYGISTEVVSFEEEIAFEQELKFEGESVTRAPVVTIMGHVDHGKTTLLDYIRKSSIAEGEHGGITQHIGAYKLVHNKQPIVFLDTPGHEAFTRLRARGAKVTDIVILIVAADDGVMPQTVESIQHARAAKVPIIVAITKIDKPQANVDKVKKGLSEQNVLLESWGGDVVSVEVSGKTGQGVTDLLEMILLVAEMQNLKAYPDIHGMGTVLEARLDRARGPVATVLVQNGSVEVGDFFIAGTTTGKVKAMLDENGNRVKKAHPSTPVEILGFNDVPEAGDQYQIVEDETKARQMVTFRHEQTRQAQIGHGAKLSLDDLFSQIEEGKIQELPLIIKGDVKGSVEALSDSLEKLGTDEVKVKIMIAQPGAITESEVLLASASTAIIIGFNVRAQKKAEKLAEKEGVEIRTYNVIYEVTKDIKDALRGMLAPTFREVVLGKAEIRQTFKVPKIGVIAGCYVTDGLMRRNANARLIRDDIVLFDGKVSSLKRFKEDVREVKNGFECGIGLDGYQDLREGDVIEMYIKEEVAAEM